MGRQGAAYFLRVCFRISDRGHENKRKMHIGPYNYLRYISQLQFHTLHIISGRIHLRHIDDDVEGVGPICF